MTRSITTLGDVTDAYDVILCDVWGVLHNGIDAFPLAGEALTAAREKGLTVVLITNSPRPAIGVIPQLRAIGVPEIAAFLRGESTLEQAEAQGAQATRNYAKRQFTWFRRQPPPEWPRTPPIQSGSSRRGGKLSPGGLDRARFPSVWYTA